MNQEFTRICDYLGGHLGASMRRIPEYIANQLQEIRLRVHRPVVLYATGSSYYLQINGTLSPVKNNHCYQLTPQDIQSCFRLVCEYSVHSFQEEIKQGFVTIRGGHRVGLSGTGLIEQGQVIGMKDISSLNIRVAKQIKGVADSLIQHVFRQGLCSILIIGGVGSGKTTLLRDVVFQLGNGTLGRPVKIAVIDERGEIAATYQGVPQHDVGCHTDVYHLYPKAVGMSMALRSLSPHVIVCDEIGREDDITQLLESMHTGTFVIATAHGTDVSQVQRRGKIADFLSCGGFEHAVILEGYQKPGAIKSIQSLLS